MTYEEALQYIASLAPRGWRLGLDRMKAFCDQSGLASSLAGPKAPAYVHVAGTNGKGSTTAYLQSLLVAAGKVTGAYFSPFVIDPRERVQLGMEMISECALAEITEELQPLAEAFTDTEFGGITEFEFKTALGFRFWQHEKCEWVALEVGLGGRLDATNVVTPRSSVIVSIGRDHMHILGNTLEEIAFEKAGVVKPGVPLVIGEMEDGPRDVIETVARDRNAPIWTYGREVAWENGTIRTPSQSIANIQTGLVGAMQGHNCALAVAALEAAGLVLSPDQIREGSANARIPGRFELRYHQGKEIRLDGAHNEQSAQNLRRSLDQSYPERQVVLLTNMLHGHETELFYSPLRDRIRHAVVVPISFNRARSVEETVADLTAMDIPASGVGSIQEGLETAISYAEQDELVLVTGSFFLVGEVLTCLSQHRGDR